jgi:peptidyl-prolyl cis-trans isomerase A (cyclophilin A)
MNLTARSLVVLALAFGGCSKKAKEPQFEPTPTPAAEPAPAAAEPVPAAEQADPAPAQAAKEQAAAPSQPSLMEAPKAVVRQPSAPDPLGGKFTLAEATAELPKKGALTATIETSAGTIECKLYEDKAPNTVANFVGLARGLRPFWDGRAAAWVKRPLYDGTSFHRVIPDFMIQGGDQYNDGTGEVGYVIPDELAPGLSHDRAGLLCMANRGPNTNGGQFFITDAATPHLTQMKSYSIFGECKPLDVIAKIARAPKAHPMSERPEPLIGIQRVQIARK